MLKRFIAIIALCVVPFLSARAGSTHQASEREDALVLKAALHSQCESGKGFVLLSSMAAAPRTGDDIGDADESGAFDDLKRRNSSVTALPEGLSCKAVRLREEREIKVFFEQDSVSAEELPVDDAWKRLYESFPGAKGWMTLSLPGYSPDGAIALVYVARYCGSLCGGGSYVYLRRTDGGWKVLFSFPTWVS